MDKLGFSGQMLILASQVIPQIIHMVKALIDKGYAYESSGDVYFIASKFQGAANYQVKADELKPGVEWIYLKKGLGRLGSVENSPEGEIGWPSPWGEGRPGWHIECWLWYRNTWESQLILRGGRARYFPINSCPVQSY